MQPPAVANVGTDNYIHDQDESCITDNELIKPTDQSLSVTSFQVSNNNLLDVQNMIYIKIIYFKG